MQLARNIENYTQTYLKHNFEKVQVKYRFRKILEILNQYKPKKLLEIGCGMDSIFNHYKDFEKLYIIEPSEIFATKALDDSRENKDVFIIQDYLENSIEKFKNIEFDFILLSGLLHEIDNPKKLLEDTKKLLNKNTTLHINVPNFESFHLLWAKASNLIKLGELTPTAKSLQQNTTFNLNKLIDIASDTGFEIIEKGSYFMKPFNHKKMEELVELGIIDEILLDGLYELTKNFTQNGSEIYVNCRLK